MSSTERTRLFRPAEVRPAPMTDTEEVRAAYLHERNVTVSQRLELIVALWLVGLAIVVVFEHVSLPEQAWAAPRFHGVAGLTGPQSHHHPRRRRTPDAGRGE